MTLLNIENLSVGTNRGPIVKDFSLELEPGEWLALVGQSGSGKSLTAFAIGQLLDAGLQSEGNIQFKNRNLLKLKRKEMRKLRGAEIAYIFQDYTGSFTPFLTIAQHFDEVQQTHRKQRKAERRKRMIDALLSVGLGEELADRLPFQLSGGQLQRVSIALALLLKPALLIADEPTTALDSVSAAHILRLLADLQKETGCAILFITHDLRHAAKFADRLAVMKNGELVEIGPKQQVLEQPVHEYTKLLVQTAPFLNRRKEQFSVKADA